MPAPSSLPEKAADTSAERPWPVRLLSAKIGDYVDRMPSVWVEGQVVQLNRRPGARTFFLTLRDPDVDLSLSVGIPAGAIETMPVPLRDGARVVLLAKPTFWARRGTLQLEARAIRPVGEGELLARLEHLKRVLAAEGLFARERKRALPFLPRRVGLVCGRNSAAERDVVENARRRWPALAFEIREVPVQGTDAVEAVRGALAELDADERVDVIVITRGGGSFEDLLPFSNEALVRAVAAATTPVVSAIGHEVDTPLLDFVADVRASTPTEAAERIAPDAAQELAALAAATGRLRGALRRRLDGECARLHDLRTRPVLSSPHGMLEPHRRELDRLRDRSRHITRTRLARAGDHLTGVRAQLRALSPQAVLERGYAIVRHADGRIITDGRQAGPEELLHVRVAGGDFAVRAVPSPEAAPAAPAPGAQPRTEEDEA